MMTQTESLSFLSEVADFDPDLAHSMTQELNRQRFKIELIASENFTSPKVMRVLGTWLTNKYAEGLPGRRYYGGCEHVDEIEQLAINRAKALFGAAHANVQPHSGADANNAVYFALLTPGDTVMGMNLSHGGHLTHGSPVNISGKYFKFVAYGVDEATEQINYDELEKMALETRPRMIVAGASAYPRVIDFERFSAIAKKAGALLMVDMAHIAGLVAAGLHPNPVQWADVVTSTTHKTLRGPRSGLILCRSELEKTIDKAVFPGMQGGPHMHVIAAKAVAFKEAMCTDFVAYQQQVIANARHLAAELTNAGFKLVSGGTDNHLMLLDLRNKGITGKAAEKALDLVGITCNKNTVPFETESPFVTSGIRIGTPAMTTRGMKEPEMTIIADLISRIIHQPDNLAVADAVRNEVQALSSRFTLYPAFV